jgi:GntR family transcriptional regulator
VTNLSKIPLQALSLNRNSKIPLHEQLYEILRSRLESDQYDSGDRFFTEADLIENFEISRNTARQVLSRLTSEGYIIRERGKGTTVAKPSLEQSLEKIVSFTDEMNRRGMKPDTVVLSQDTVKPTEIQAQSLRIKPETELICIKRLRLGDHIPICIEESYLVKAYFPNLSDINFAQFPLKKAIESMLNSRLDFAQQKIKAIPASEDIAHVLKTEPHSPILYIERITYTGNIPVEFLKIYYRGDRFTLFNELVG